tara:strand:- start:308 stop:484 length:177 start_codon:yes stop_codon:yes gene_type:complete
MENKYSIEEILGAVDDLQKMKKKVKNFVNLKKKEIVNESSSIPKNTLKLIEEAEKSKN